MFDKFSIVLNVLKAHLIKYKSILPIEINVEFLAIIYTKVKTRQLTGVTGVI